LLLFYGFFIAGSIKASRKILIGGYAGEMSFLFLLIFLALLDSFSNFGLHYILQHPFWVFDVEVIGALWSAVVMSLLFGAIFGILIASLLCYFFLKPDTRYGIQSRNK